ncbi:MAG: hypothetical protein PHR35_06375 [Kiritimatiellae bacterium]|nr:hypothetical protein [Kiritimatiellia bacterium]
MNINLRCGITAALLGTVAANLDAGVVTAWYRFEEGTAGADLDDSGYLVNSGDASTSAFGRNWHTDGSQPKYAPVEASRLQVGASGGYLSNRLCDGTGASMLDTDVLHGGGVVDMYGFSFNGDRTQTIEFFYRTPPAAEWEVATNIQERIFMCNKVSPVNHQAYILQIRYLPSGGLYLMQTAYTNASTLCQNACAWTGPTQPDTWYHFAMVLIDGSDATNGVLPDKVVGQNPSGGGDVHYEAGKSYFFINHELVKVGPHFTSYYNPAARAWFGGNPENYKNWEVPTGVYMNLSTIGYYDEIRFTFNAGGSHDLAAALHPDDFLRMAPLPGTVVTIR